MNYFLQLFKGRLSRTQWLVGFVIMIIITGIFSSAIIATINEYKAPNLLYVLMVIPVYFLASIHARRFHDMNVSGFASILAFVPILGLLVVLALLIVEGTKGSNKYGEIDEKNSWWKAFYHTSI